MDLYPQLPFVLIGDSGQEDPRIYAELAQQRPGRILAKSLIATRDFGEIRMTSFMHPQRPLISG